MEQLPDWLADVVVLNESTDERVPGDVSVHRSDGDALLSLEATEVRHGLVFAFTATGVRLVLDTDGSGAVVVASRQICAEGPEIVLGWLRALARSQLEARRRTAAQGRAVLGAAEAEGTLPTGVEGLVAYVGLPWTRSRDRFMPGCLLLLALVALLLALNLFSWP